LKFLSSLNGVDLFLDFLAPNPAPLLWSLEF